MMAMRVPPSACAALITCWAGLADAPALPAAADDEHAGSLSPSAAGAVEALFTAIRTSALPFLFAVPAVMAPLLCTFPPAALLPRHHLPGAEILCSACSSAETAAVAISEAGASGPDARQRTAAISGAREHPPRRKSSCRCWHP